MLSFLVRQRRREIGIRMALGASPSNVRRRVLGHGLTIGLAGTLLRTGVRAGHRPSRPAAPVRSHLVRSTHPDWHGGVIAHGRHGCDGVADAHGHAHDPLLVLRSECGCERARCEVRCAMCDVRCAMTTALQAVRQAIRVVRSHPGFGAPRRPNPRGRHRRHDRRAECRRERAADAASGQGRRRASCVITKRLPTGSTAVPFTPAEMTAWGDAARTLDAVGGVQYDGAWPWPAELGDRALTVTGTAVSGNFFEVLGARPAAGRLLVAADARAGSEDVAVIGYGLWRREFGGDPGVAGRRIRLNGRSATIVGVAPAGFTIPKNADVWQPLTISADAMNEGWFSLVARLKPGATLAQAVDESASLLDRLRAVAPRSSPQDTRAAVAPLKEAVVGDVRPVIALFVAAAVLLFLVGCLNVMTLLLVRGTRRERELSVCSALGATRSRLITQLLAESAILAVAGGAAGALVAFWLQRWLLATTPAGVPRLDQVGFDGLYSRPGVRRVAGRGAAGRRRAGDRRRAAQPVQPLARPVGEWPQPDRRADPRGVATGIGAARDGGSGAAGQEPPASAGRRSRVRSRPAARGAGTAGWARL